MAGSASARILFPYNNISIRKLRENRAPKARREKQAARLVLTSRAAMLMGEGKKYSRNLFFVINHKDMFVVALKFLNFATFYI